MNTLKAKNTILKLPENFLEKILHYDYIKNNIPPYLKIQKSNITIENIKYQEINLIFDFNIEKDIKAQTLIINKLHKYEITSSIKFHLTYLYNKEYYNFTSDKQFLIDIFQYDENYSLEFSIKHTEKYLSSYLKAHEKINIALSKIIIELNFDTTSLQIINDLSLSRNEPCPFEFATKAGTNKKYEILNVVFNINHLLKNQISKGDFLKLHFNYVSQLNGINIDQTNIINLSSNKDLITQDIPNNQYFLIEPSYKYSYGKTENNMINNKKCNKYQTSQVHGLGGNLYMEIEEIQSFDYQYKKKFNNNNISEREIIIGYKSPASHPLEPQTTFFIQYLHIYLPDCHIDDLYNFTNISTIKHKGVIFGDNFNNLTNKVQKIRVEDEIYFDDLKCSILIDLGKLVKNTQETTKAESILTRNFIDQQILLQPKYLSKEKNIFEIYEEYKEYLTQSNLIDNNETQNKTTEADIQTKVEGIQGLAIAQQIQQMINELNNFCLKKCQFTTEGIKSIKLRFEIINSKKQGIIDIGQLDYIHQTININNGELIYCKLQGFNRIQTKSNIVGESLIKAEFVGTMNKQEKSATLTIVGIGMALFGVGLFVAKMSSYDFKSMLLESFGELGLGTLLVIMGTIDIGLALTEFAFGSPMGVISLAAGILDITTGIMLLNDAGQTLTKITESDIYKWKDGIKEHFKKDLEKLSSPQKDAFAQSLILYSITYSYCPDISALIHSFGNDKVESITLRYLDNILKKGPAYIYQTSNKKLSFEQADSIYALFVNRQNLAFTKNFIMQPIIK